MSMINHRFLLSLFFLVAFGGCTQSTWDDGSLSVVVSIEPQKFFVEKIAGDRIGVEVLVPAGKEPETYVPTPDKIKKLARGRIFFRVGFPSEATFLPKLKTLSPKLKVIDTRDNLQLREMEEHNAHGCAHCEGGTDPHIWLSPTQVLQQVDTILQALIELDPEGKEEFEENAEIFRQELEQVRAEIAGMLAPHQGETVYVYHPAYGYFCDEFGLKQRAIEVDGKEPKIRELAEWKRQAKEDGARIILVQPEFNPAPAELVAKEIGATVVTHSPLASDYLNNLVELARIIATDRNL